MSLLTRAQAFRFYGDVRGRGTNRYSAKNAAALQAFRAALGNRENAPCNVLVIGNSTEEGFSGTGSVLADRTKAWPSVLGKVLRARFPTTGETISQAVNFAPILTTSTIPTGFTATGTWTTSNNGLNTQAARSVIAGSTQTYTVPVGTTDVDVLACGGSGVTGFTVSVDGGAESATLGLTSSTGSFRDGELYTAARSLDPSVTHTIRITTVGTNNYIDGLFLYAGNLAKGIRVFNAGRYGSASQGYLAGAGYSWLRAPTTDPNTWAGVQTVKGCNPDLIIVGLQENDYQSWNAATFSSQVAQIIAACRVQVTKSIPVLYLSKWRPGATWTPNSDSWDTYRAATQALAAADPLGAYLDLADVIPQPLTTLATSLSLFNDNIHAKAKGYGMTADAIASFIAP